MEQHFATTAAEAFDTLDPFALLRPGDPWYSDLEARFGRQRYGLVGALVRRLRPRSTRPDFVHVGVVGHRGSGKTTLVRKAADELSAQGLHALFVDAVASFDQGDLSFADLVLVIARTVINGLHEEGVEVPETQLELLKLWFAEELLTETHRTQILGAVEAEAGILGGIPFLAKLTAKITAALKSDNDYRREIRKRVDRDPDEVVRRLNRLLDSANDALSAKYGSSRRLLVIVDNLQKLVAREQVDAAVLRRAESLRELRCNLVLFFSPEDQYAPIKVQAGQAFDVVTLPMLPLRERADPWSHLSPAAHDAVKDLLERRVDIVRVFSPVDQVVQEIARWSGGRLRDVFHLARLACELADPDAVTPGLVELAAKRLAAERVSLAKTESWPRLRSIARDKQVSSDTDGFLLQHLLVLNYDGEPWFDVHPLIRFDPRFMTE